MSFAMSVVLTEEYNVMGDREKLIVRLRLKCDGAHTETRFRLSAKWKSPFKSAGCQFSRLLAGELCTSACRVCPAHASLCSAVM